MPTHVRVRACTRDRQRQGRAGQQASSRLCARPCTHLFGQLCILFLICGLWVLREREREGRA